METNIDESKFITLGGVEQFLIVRGKYIENPVLLLLHGGVSETAHFVKFNHDLEKQFIVVYWEQRGEGKSYVKGSDSKLLTLDRYLEDIHELTQQLKERFEQEKIYLLGHSFGTLLGMKSVEKYPNDYEAYIAVSQVTDPIKSDHIGHDTLLEAAKEAGNTKDVEKILAIERITKENLLDLDLTTRTNELIQLSMKYGGFYYESSFLQMLSISLSPIWSLKEYNLKDKVRAIKQNEERILFYYQNSLIDTVTEVEVPVYFIHGEEDYVCNYFLAEEYYHKLKAPKKEFFTFWESAHFPPFEEAKKFNEIVINQILLNPDNTVLIDIKLENKKEIFLESGRKIFLETINQHQTYGGLLDGIPYAEQNEESVKYALKYASENMHPSSPYLIPPKSLEIDGVDKSMERCENAIRLPYITCFGIFESSVLKGKGFGAGSHLTVVWYQDEYAMPIDAYVLEHIKKIDWEKEAEEYDL